MSTKRPEIMVSIFNGMVGMIFGMIVGVFIGVVISIFVMACVS